jgi:energy-coupling factor transporter ATP-binding protein EcfA2
VDEGLLEKLAERFKAMRYERYKVFVLVGRPASGKSALAKAVAGQVSATYLNCLSDVLPQVKDVPLGVFGPLDLKRFIVEGASKGGLVVDEIEPLVSTFPKGEKDVIDFYSLLADTEARYPILLVTRLGNLLKGSSFPAKRVHEMD